MITWKPTISWQTNSQELQKFDNQRISIESTALLVRFPFGGFVWNRPTAVIIAEGDYHDSNPIMDITRIAQFSIYGIGMVCFLGGLLLINHSSKKNKKEKTNG